MPERSRRGPGTRHDGPPLVKVGELEAGQVVRPYASLEPWTVESLEPNPDDPHAVTLTLRNASGERRSDPHDRRMWIHGDWPGGVDPDEGVPGASEHGPLPF